MGHFRFRDRIKLLPGVHVNLSKTGASLSVGAPGASVNVGKQGVRTTTGIPGSGLSYSHLHKAPRPAAAEPEPEKSADREALESVANLFPDEPETLCVFLWLNESQAGPYSWFQVLVMLADETISFETAAWTAQQDQWRPLSDFDIEDMVKVFRKVMAIS